MKHIIPGHVRAVTWMLAIVLIMATGSIVASLLVTGGFFLVDQADHLAQADHSGPPPTWIEQMQQDYRWASVILGLILVGVGGYMMTGFWK